MIHIFKQFHDHLINNKINFKNEKFVHIIQSYAFLFVDDKKDISFKEEIHKNMQESEIIIINQMNNKNLPSENLFLIVVFKKTIIIIEPSLLPSINSLFYRKTNLKILFLSHTKEIFDSNLTIKYENYEMSENYKREIENFKEYSTFETKDKTTRELSKRIHVSISNFLLIQSYHKLNQDRIKNFISEENDRSISEKFEINNFLELRNIGSGFSAKALLAYNILEEKLCVIKKITLESFQGPNIDSIPENIRISQREIKNYAKMLKHPFLPKYYGTVGNENSIVIEYINGQTFENIQNISLTENDKITIIFELLIVFEFIHKHHFIYRDLKPDNLMIDKNKTIVLIDFDRMLNYDDFSKIDQFTNDFYSKYMAPEVNSGKFSYECDIYSIGMMMAYIIIGKEKFNKNEFYDFGKYSTIKKMYEKCTKKEPKERPTIHELIQEFYINYQFQIQINIDDLMKFFDIDSINTNDETDNLYILGLTNLIERNYEQSIYYFTLAAERNHMRSQFRLGQIYFENTAIQQDIQKSIHYFSLAANQNYDEAQYQLGKIYLTRDIDKSIYFFTLAANQDHANSQIYLGNIYINSEFKRQDINKGINYFTLAADKNIKEAHFELFLLYYQNKYIPRNINKAMNYLHQAANLNHVEAQYYLGYYYNLGKNVPFDINKAIQYYTCAASNKYIEAQFRLGYIFYKGEFVVRNIENAISYLKLAADQNHIDAQSLLGQIYYENKYIKQDINKAIYYYTLAANQNNSFAKYNLNIIYNKGEQFSINNNVDINYLKNAAHNNNLQAQLMLSDYYLKGINVVQNIDEAIKYLNLAANQNCPVAQYNLGMAYFNKKDISKSIKFFTLAANQNFLDAQINLAYIYSKKEYGVNDINKTIHYLTLAAKQKNKMSIDKLRKIYFNLGAIYYKGQKVTRDINKSLHYLNLSAELDLTEAQHNLGVIYYLGQYVEIDIDKAIYYFTKAAEKNNVLSSFVLGFIYFDKKYKPRDLNKAIQYFSKAANENIADAQYYLGVSYFECNLENPDVNKIIPLFFSAAKKNQLNALFALGIIYYEGFWVEKDLKKGINFFEMAAKNGYIGANFLLGFHYHQFEDIKKAISYYKEASSFNDKYAKNNLGIIYKNGFGDEIPKNTQFAIELFSESIRKKNDSLAMYNLSHIYLYEMPNYINVNKAIELLIKSVKNGFIQSIELLSLALIKKYGFDINNIKIEIEKYSNKSSSLFIKIMQIIKIRKLNDLQCFEIQYQFHRNIDYLYNNQYKYIPSGELLNYKIIQSLRKINKRKDVTDDFYAGFGINIIK